ncbi:hypothetical protein Nepgr_031065 [Nepenthes gracilis]|uniref:Uncharacterized protein n=1 Tax=Nepenthes gracilis TaxID=150966 RepID=A0AAD3TI56_NEPGR|nr:hypothetical protein Nepgr_031065 [Nepenthes gracilis]
MTWKTLAMQNKGRKRRVKTNDIREEYGIQRQRMLQETEMEGQRIIGLEGERLVPNDVTNRDGDEGKTEMTWKTLVMQNKGRKRRVKTNDIREEYGIQVQRMFQETEMEGLRIIGPEGERLVPNDVTNNWMLIVHNLIPRHE